MRCALSSYYVFMFRAFLSTGVYVALVALPNFTYCINIALIRDDSVLPSSWNMLNLHVARNICHVLSYWTHFVYGS